MSDGTILLLEAKAHISEVLSYTEAEDLDSIAKINKAFDRTKKELGIRTMNPWTIPFYQYANRIAHPHFLKNITHIPAYLIFVNFIGDAEVRGPKEEAQWKGVTALIHAYLGIRRMSLLKNFVEVCIDVGNLEERGIFGLKRSF